MKKSKLRREITFLFYEGVALDGNLVFSATCADRKQIVMQETKISTQMDEMLISQQASVKTMTIQMKVISYLDGVLEVLVAPETDIATVAATIAGTFSRESNFIGLDFLILNYRGISLKIGKTTGRKSIIAMIMKALSKKGSVQQEKVDFTLQTLPDDVEKFVFERIPNEWYYGGKKFLRFKVGRKILDIAEIKDGVITPEFSEGPKISDIIMGMKKLFLPVSNLYGIQAIELQMNHFEYRMDKDSDVGKIYALFKRAIWINMRLDIRLFERFLESLE